MSGLELPNTHLNFLVFNMKEQQFKTFIQSVTPHKNDYERGYARGLRRHYHGENFGTPSEHDKWMNIDGHRKALGDGYRAGFEGLPPNGYHGNQNARKEETADSTLVVRLNSQVKAGYVKQAQKEGLKLSEWVLKKLSSREI